MDSTVTQKAFTSGNSVLKTCKNVFNKKVGMLAFVSTTALSIMGCATNPLDDVHVNTWGQAPHVYGGIAYEHPVDVIYPWRGNRGYNGNRGYLEHSNDGNDYLGRHHEHGGAWAYLSNHERESAEHYLWTAAATRHGDFYAYAHTYNGGVSVEGHNGRDANNVMRVYRNLYKQGHDLAHPGKAEQRPGNFGDAWKTLTEGIKANISPVVGNLHPSIVPEALESGTVRLLRTEDRCRKESGVGVDGHVDQQTREPVLYCQGEGPQSSQSNGAPTTGSYSETNTGARDPHIERVASRFRMDYNAVKEKDDACQAQGGDKRAIGQRTSTRIIFSCGKLY